MTTWRELIALHMSYLNENWSDIISCTLSDDELDVKFDSGYGRVEGVPFTLWTTRRVYFPVMYDGAEWVDSVPRNPCDKKTVHIGG